jgi:putative flavoprotein involved in K+ transport
MASGQLDRRPMLTAFDYDRIIWPDGTHEQVDTIMFATGYRPHLATRHGSHDQVRLGA